MNPISVDPEIIPMVFYWTMLIVCALLYFSYAGSNGCDKLLKKNSPIPALLLTIFFTVFIGLRPIWWGFGDTVTYARTYMRTEPVFGEIDWGEEWLFSLIRVWCRTMGFSVSGFFIVIAMGYFGFMYWAFRKALWENAWLAMLYALSAYSLFTYGVNGMRNGLACSLETLAIVFAAKDKNYVIAGLMCFLAMGIHKSTLLPTAALVTAVFVIKNPKYALYFWIMSIPLSLVAGGPISNFFMGMGFDDRATSYMSGDNMQYGNFSSTGFRWDFLLYSSMPVLLIWYAQKRIEEKRMAMGRFCPEEEESGVYGAGILADAESMRVFNVLSVVYLLTNAFWVMVIKAAFSNRFAYLSWFLYPMVLAYGVIRLHIWDDQDKKAGLFLVGQMTFTMFMYIQGNAF